MVCPPHAIIDPWAVMVVALNAAIAYVAVSALRQSNHLTEGAQRLRIERLHERDELDLTACLDVTGSGHPDRDENEKICYQEGHDDH